MKITKGFILSANEAEEYVFFNENDRNEMALAIYQEDILNQFNIEANWYASYYADMMSYTSVKAVLARMVRDAHEVVFENMLTYEIKLVEG